MDIFADEQDLLQALDLHDQLMRDCAEGRVDWSEFDARYDTFYMRCALDGHESDEEEQRLLALHEDRIALHRDIWNEILTRVCADDDAERPAYIAAGRFGSAGAAAHLRALAAKYWPSTNAD